MLVETLCTTEQVAVVTLADPGHRNAISLELADELDGVLCELDADPDVRAIVLTGRGPAFCAGADRAALSRADEAILRRIYRPFLTVRSTSVPTVAAVNGPAVGAGLNLALACDVRIAGTSALFDARFMSIPIHPGGGHTRMLREIVGPQAAAAMTVFNHPVDGPRAAAIGLAWTCVADAELLDAALGFCGRITATPPSLLRTVTETFEATAGLTTHEDACEYELVHQLATVGLRARLQASGGVS
ncbi:enoyl-CoA hydratase-related protein [Pseudonocardia sp. RS010]|uniref:enoyl-CoA hydratase-related protein n=1 Tax=Pseudonocardia sp. RS010 TaxID=3385979 RepID=UPI0039A1D42D